MDLLVAAPCASPSNTPALTSASHSSGRSHQLPAGAAIRAPRVHLRSALIGSNSRLLSTKRAAAQNRNRKQPSGVTPVRATVASEDVAVTAGTFIPAAPILLPPGPWKEIPGGVTAAKGFKAFGMHAGLRAAGKKPDLALVVCDTDAQAAGAFTLNVMAAAPVVYCKQALAESQTARAVLINAGQANAATGDEGFKDTVECAEALAKTLGVEPSSVLILSTGVIGQRIKKAPLIAALPTMVDSLAPTAVGGMAAAVGITTTDLVSKSVAVEIEIDGHPVRLGGMAKGSGMIHPNMATMLAVVTCDADVSTQVWRAMAAVAVKRSFNQITVDGDCSTNDTVVTLASGMGGGALIDDPASEAALQLQAALDAVCQGLAKSIAWDGEGATCLIEVAVSGADDEAAAASVAKSIAGSSLVKAAIFGRDPNWGRIACAAGYAGIDFDPDSLRIQLGDIVLMEGGQPLSFDRSAASGYLTQQGDVHGTVIIDISIGTGAGSSKAWGCDLSYDYVKINAEYTT